MTTIIFITYVILSAFGIAGTEMFDDDSPLTKTILCVIFGWILFPCIIMFVFGKFISNLNDEY